MATPKYGNLDWVRQNYHEDSEKGVNKQINMEMYAMYTYLSMASYYDRADVALPNFAEYFRSNAKEEFEHAMKLMKFQNERGGLLKLEDIKAPAKEDWGLGIDGMMAALELERKVNDSLLKLHAVADKHNDYQMSDFIEGNYLHEQVEAIKELSGHITNLKRVGEKGHGEYHFERASLS